MKAFQVVALSLGLASCAGVYGPKGNDTGGIIPWSSEAELHKLEIAQAGCDRWGKYAQITSVVRGYGNYIAYVCHVDPPHRFYRHREALSVRG